MEGGERWGWWCLGEGGKDEGGGEGWREALTFGSPPGGTHAVVGGAQESGVGGRSEEWVEE